MRKLSQILVGSVNYTFPLQSRLFNFLTQSLSGADPTTTDREFTDSGYAMLDRWLAFQLFPIIPINVIQPLEDIFLHSFAFPFFIVFGDYRKLSSFIEAHDGEVLQRCVDEFRLTREEALHNLLFILGFNSIVTIFNTAASNQNGIDSFHKLVGRLENSAVSATGARLVFKSNEEIAVEVRTIPLDMVVFDSEPVALVKIDVQGWEYVSCICDL